MQMKEATPFSSADLFKALAEPNRLKILQRLCGCREAQSVSEMSDCCEIDLSVVSRHLAQLKAAGVVTAE
ncbi:MAG: metalloregulator ArsR/SmtB family transcription factor, partial [Verrucomicrobiota bacterium]